MERSDSDQIMLHLRLHLHIIQEQKSEADLKLLKNAITIKTIKNITDDKMLRYKCVLITVILLFFSHYDELMPFSDFDFSLRTLVEQPKKQQKI